MATFHKPGNMQLWSPFKKKINLPKTLLFIAPSPYSQSGGKSLNPLSSPDSTPTYTKGNLSHASKLDSALV